jgi:hypothetical protein
MRGPSSGRSIKGNGSKAGRAVERALYSDDAGIAADEANEGNGIAAVGTASHGGCRRKLIRDDRDKHRRFTKQRKLTFPDG